MGKHVFRYIFKLIILVTFYQRFYRKVPRSYGSDFMAFNSEAIDGTVAYNRFPSKFMED